MAQLNSNFGFKERCIDIASFENYKNSYTEAPLSGIDLFSRANSSVNYVREQKKAQMWVNGRKLLSGVDCEGSAIDQNNNIIYGLNFSSADYMGLAKNQFAIESAIEAAQTFGVNSAGSPLAFGATKYYMQLKDEIADFLQMKGTIIYSGGWLAGFGVVKGYIRQDDYVIIDEYCESSLMEGANAATNNVINIPHLNHEKFVENIRKTRELNKNAGILVVTAGLFSVDSQSPDLNLLQKCCKEYNAILLVDSTNDFGCIGQAGRGVLELQGVKDKSNIIFLGSGSRSLSTNIGFIAMEDNIAAQFLKYFSTSYMFTNAINPVQAATALANLRNVKSHLGNQLRKKIISNYHLLKSKLQEKGHKVTGKESPIVIVEVGEELVCKLAARIMMDKGIFVNTVEWPEIKLGTAKIKISLMPHHTEAHMNSLVEVLTSSLAKARTIFVREFNKYLQSNKCKNLAKL